MLLSLVLTGCKEKYEGSKIISIEYQTIDYNGGSYFSKDERFYFFREENILIFKGHHGDLLNTSDIEIGTILKINGKN